MFDAITRLIEQSLEFIGTQLLIVLAYPFFPNQRIFWLYLCSSGLIALYVFYLNSRSDPAHKSSFKAFIGFLFPKDIWRRSSAWLDVRYFFFHQIIRVVIYGAFLAGVLNLVFQMITGGPNPIEASELKIGLNFADIAISTAYMFVLIAFADFVSYGIHYLQHKVPLLWEFHRVHQ